MYQRERDQDRTSRDAKPETDAARKAVWMPAAIGFAALVVMLLIIYWPGIGHGFVKDDVRWVAANRVASVQDARGLMFGSNGFYRPLVAASFALDRALYGIEPFGYGVTNILLLIASAAALAWAARGVGLSAMSAVIAAAIWAFNLHGIDMAVLWLSGRTELWLVLCAFLSAGAVARGRPVLAGVMAFAAMLSKEEAVMLPAMLAGWAFVLGDSVGIARAMNVDPAHKVAANAEAARDRDGRTALRASARVPHRGRSALVAAMIAALRQTWLAWLALGVYVVLRARTGAYTPATTPWFYQFTFDPFRVVTNMGEYLDRACTLSAIIVGICALLAWRRPGWTPLVQRLVALALIWLVGGYALTVFLPVRSSLYACFPSAGVAMLAAAIVDSLRASATTSTAPAPLATAAVAAVAATAAAAASAGQRRLLAALAVPVLLLPVYWSRNERWVELADVGADTFATVRRVVREAPDVRQIVFEDDRETRRSLLNTYGALLPTAVTLAAGRPIPVWLDPPPDDWHGSDLVPLPAGSSSAGSSGRIVTLKLERGRLVLNFNRS